MIIQNNKAFIIASIRAVSDVFPVGADRIQDIECGTVSIHPAGYQEGSIVLIVCSLPVPPEVSATDVWPKDNEFEVAACVLQPAVKVTTPSNNPTAAAFPIWFFMIFINPFATSW